MVHLKISQQANNNGINLSADNDQLNEIQGNEENENTVQQFLQLRNSSHRSHVLSIEEREMFLKVRTFVEYRKAANWYSDKEYWQNVVRQTTECLDISENTDKRVTREAVSG